MKNHYIKTTDDFQEQISRSFEQISNLASKESSEQFKRVLDMQELFNRYFSEVKESASLVPDSVGNKVTPSVGFMT